MASATGGDQRARRGETGKEPESDLGVADLFRRLNLIEAEGEVAAFSDDEEDSAVVQWAVVGKVLSPSTIHATTIKGAMKPVWGNSCGLKIHSIGEKSDNLFIAEFGDQFAMERALEGSPWLVGKHAVIHCDYDDRLVPSEIVFDKTDLWVRILNLPLGWMTAHRGSRAMGLVGDVKKWMWMQKAKPAAPSFVQEWLLNLPNHSGGEFSSKLIGRSHRTGLICSMRSCLFSVTRVGY